MNHMCQRSCAFALLVLATGSAALAVDSYPNAQFTPLHTAECVSATNRIVPQYTSVPNDAVYMHVRHMGIPGSVELANQVANSVTWDPSSLTGFQLPGYYYRYLYQRGYKNDPVLGTNVFQLYCRSAGFLINTYQFNHNGQIECPVGLPDCSGGPNVAYSRSFSQPIQVWDSPDDELTLQGYFKLPHIHHDNDGTQGVGQLTMFYTLQDPTSGVVIFGLMGLYDSRPLDTNCSGTMVGCEFQGDDGVASAFFSSPLRSQQANGAALELATKSPYSATFQPQWGWSAERFYRGHVKYEQMQTIAARLQGLGASQNPEDWRLSAVGVLAEVFPGPAQNLNNIVVGGSFRYFEAYRAHD